MKARYEFSVSFVLIIAVYLWFCALCEAAAYDDGTETGAAVMEIRAGADGISSANWMAMGAIIWLLMGRDVNYFFVLGVLLVNGIAGVIVHIPAGIGVLEAVFIARCWRNIRRKGTIIAALLAYRVLYYFIPLLLALVALHDLTGRRSCGRKTERAMAK